MSIAMSTFAFYVVEFPSGGTGTAVLHTANELTKRGHRVFIYTARHLDDGYPLGYQPHFEVVTVPTINADTDENIRFLRNHITNNCVEALIVVAMHFLRLKELRENNSCKIVYALHGCPFYEEKLFNIWLFCNSSLFWLIRENMGRTNLGGGMLKAEAIDLKNVPIIFDFNKFDEIKKIMEKLSNYIVEDTTIEIKKDYHIAIDKLVFDYLEIDDDTREKLLKELVDKINSRYKKMLK